MKKQNTYQWLRNTKFRILNHINPDHLTHVSFHGYLNNNPNEALLCVVHKQDFRSDMKKILLMTSMKYL